MTTELTKRRRSSPNKLRPTAGTTKEAERLMAAQLGHTLLPSDLFPRELTPPLRDHMSQVIDLLVSAEHLGAPVSGAESWPHWTREPFGPHDLCRHFYLVPSKFSFDAKTEQRFLRLETEVTQLRSEMQHGFADINSAVKDAFKNAVAEAKRSLLQEMAGGSKQVVVTLDDLLTRVGRYAEQELDPETAQDLFAPDE